MWDGNDVRVRGGPCTADCREIHQAGMGGFVRLIKGTVHGVLMNVT